MQSWLVSLFLDCPIGMDLHCPSQAEIEVSCATTLSVLAALLHQLSSVETLNAYNGTVYSHQA